MIPADELFGSEAEPAEAPAWRTRTAVAATAQQGWHLDTIEQALAALRAGRAIVVVDDEDRENEGDLIFAGGAATPGP